MQKGSKGQDVILLQAELNKNGANLTPDGDFGAKTEAALKAYQAKQQSPQTGTLDEETRAILFPTILNCATKFFLPRGQYVHKPSRKIGVTLHHTASGGNAYRVPEVWANDNRGRVATHFVVGADGTILQVMPLECWGYHIAMGRVGLDNLNTLINSGYIGIEICNWGVMDKTKDGKILTYTGKELPANEIAEIDFMGYKYAQKYTEHQVVAVRTLLTELKQVFGFKYESLPLNSTWLDLDKKAQRGERVLTGHTNFEGHMKSDPTPQPAFFEMIKGL